MQFTIVGEIIETFAKGPGIRDLTVLRSHFGSGRWRKRKGVATVLLANGEVRLAELHWYEAHGIGRRRMKIKTYLDK